MAAKIFTSAQATSSSKARFDRDRLAICSCWHRFIQRIIPVVLVCPAKMEVRSYVMVYWNSPLKSLIESLQVLIPTSNLSKVSSAAKFSLQLRRRMNDKFLRDDITPAVVDFVTKDSPHKLGMIIVWPSVSHANRLFGIRLRCGRWSCEASVLPISASKMERIQKVQHSASLSCRPNYDSRFYLVSF